MWEKVEPYVDSGKKLNIKGEKLFSLLIQTGFRGTVTILTGNSSTEIYFAEGNVAVSLSPSTLALHLSESRFSIWSRFRKDVEYIPGWKFLFDLLGNLQKESVINSMKPLKGENITVRPDLINQEFLLEKLTPLRGKRKIPLSGLIHADPHFAYFLLVSGFAAIIRNKKQKPDEKKSVKEDPSRLLRKLVEEHTGKETLFELLGVNHHTDSRSIQKKFLEKARVLHPDKLTRESSEVREKAALLLTRLNIAYKLLREEDTKKEIMELEKRFGKITSVEEYERFQSIAEIIRKADMASRMGEHVVSFKLLSSLYRDSEATGILDNIMSSLVKTTESQIENRGEQLLHYAELSRKEKSHTLKGLYALAEAYDQLDRNTDLKSILTLITSRYPNETQAQKWLKKVEFYAKR